MNDNTDADIELSILSGEWAVGETQKLIDEYRECPTAHGKLRLLPKLEAISKKMQFEKKIIGKMMDEI